MDSKQLTLQNYLDGRWQDAMVIRFDQPEQGLASLCSTEYVLPDLLSSLHLPEETWGAPLIPLKRLSATLQKWALI